MTNAAGGGDDDDELTRLRAQDARRSAFLGTLAHELRTLVTTVAGFADLLAEQWDNLAEHQRREFAQRLNRNALSLRLLSDDLLSYTHLDRNTLRVSPYDIDVSELVGRLVDQLSVLVPNRELTSEIEPGIRGFTDPSAVERILANLLSNAGRYTPAGTAVAVRVAIDGETIVLTVTDHGPGVPENERERVFERYERGETAGRQHPMGSGIGLALVRELAERLGGSAHVEDAPGGGARFVVRLARRAPEPA